MWASLLSHRTLFNFTLTRQLRLIAGPMTRYPHNCHQSPREQGCCVTLSSTRNKWPPALSSSQHIFPPPSCAEIYVRLGQEARKLEDACVDSIHVDIMDGHFVPNFTFGPGMVGALRRTTQLPLHVHMIVCNPAAHVGASAEADADLYYFHIEAEAYPLRLASAITRVRYRPAGLAINPFTPLATVVDLPFPHVLVMSVEPGFVGQRWIPHTARRVGELRASVRDDVTIAVDGNVREDNAVVAYEHGAELFVCGTSSIFSSDDYRAVVSQMRRRLRAAQHPQPQPGALGGP